LASGVVLAHRSRTPPRSGKVKVFLEPTPPAAQFPPVTRILFFGRTAERLGRSREIELPPLATVADLRRLLAGQDPEAADALTRPDVRASLDRVIVGEDAPVLPTQEIAFFSVFSGG
jgi:molybdopterin synthase sulfur carrier subunit